MLSFDIGHITFVLQREQEEAIEVTSIFSFLVHPSKHEANPPTIGGTSLELEGNLFQMLSSAFARAPSECNIDIAFSPAEDRAQINDRRNDILALLQDRTIDRARILAERLQEVTTLRSGLGLLFIVLGNEGQQARAYISRFPADVGIVAQEEEQALRVEFLERVFMRNTTSYKAVIYEGQNYNADFWVGKAIDKQINNRTVGISGYWIREFLLSDFRTTSAQGTRRLALAIKKTIEQTADIEIMEELTAVARLARTLDGQTVNMTNFMDRFTLLPKTRDAMTATLADPTLRFDQFQFSVDEFSEILKYQSIQIDNGAILTAPVDKFDDCFTRDKVAEANEEYRFTTQGAVVDERLIKRPR